VSIGDPLPPEPTVYILDDDVGVLDSLGVWLRSSGLKTRTWSNPIKFLDDYQLDWCGCLVLDFDMPDISGLSLQEELIAIGSTLPIIFITGHGDVQTAVQAMKAGAFDFVEKPFAHAVLLDCIQRAFERCVQARDFRGQQRHVRECLETLTPRETEVLDFVIHGKPTKVIAGELSLSQRTVEIYRANVMHKMKSKSVAELVRMLSEFHLGSPAQ
jgi:two-component system, LuxR family, response regulator FixJ